MKISFVKKIFRNDKILTSLLKLSRPHDHASNVTFSVGNVNQLSQFFAMNIPIKSKSQLFRLLDAYVSPFDTSSVRRGWNTILDTFDTGTNESGPAEENKRSIRTRGGIRIYAR